MLPFFIAVILSADPLVGPVPLDQHPTMLEMLAESNRLRVANGLQPHAIDRTLCSVAQEQAVAMARAKQLGHNVNGSFGDRLARWNVVFLSAGENAAYGQRNVTAAFVAWRNSPGHWKTLTKPETTHAGFGAFTDSAGRWWWCAVYARFP